MISKIIHQINLGNRKLSDVEREWQSSWHHHHPEWEYNIWDEKQIEAKLNITTPNILNECNSFSERSDILRFEILHQYGGVYIDTDFECLKPIDDLITDKRFLIFRQNDKYICGAFFAACKGNKKVQKLIRGLPRRFKTHGHLSAHKKYGPLYLTETLGLDCSAPDGDSSEVKTVYPFTHNNILTKSQVLEQHPESYAIHYWQKSWK